VYGIGGAEVEAGWRRIIDFFFGVIEKLTS
jgi:hypothetical protein